MTNMEELEMKALMALQADMKAKEYTAKAKEAKDALEDALAKAHMLNVDCRQLGHVRTKISPNNQFDLAGALKMLKPAVRKECMVTVPDPALVKAHLTGLQLAQAMKPSPTKPFRVALSVADDE